LIQGSDVAASSSNDDIIISHWKLVDGGGYLRLTYKPTGVSVENYTGNRPVLEVLTGLKEELSEKVKGAQVK
jgi:hypothetical protein